MKRRIRLSESELRKVIGMAVRRALDESRDFGEDGYKDRLGKWSGMDMETPVVVVGGEHEGRYTLGEVIDTLPIVGVMKDSENPSFRIRTAGFPRIEGYLGPMWDGGKIRYESQDAYDFFSA